MKTTETIDLAPYWEDIENIAKERLGYYNVGRSDYNSILEGEMVKATGELAALLALKLEPKLDPKYTGPSYIDYKNLRIRVISTKLSDVTNHVYIPESDPFDFDIVAFVTVDLDRHKTQILGFATWDEIINSPTKNVTYLGH